MRRVGLIDQVAGRFHDEITSGRWPVGAQIPIEAELAEAFGVGRNTVREALQSLVRAGLLSREQGRGTFVIASTELPGSLVRELSGGSRHHYLELRLALDSTAASLAALRRTGADVERLRELRDERERAWATADGDLRAHADLALHQAVVEATHNPLYVRLYAGMTDVFAAHMRDEESGDDETAHRHHRDLVEAIAAGDPERASALVRDIFEPFMG
ncbi:FadR/GntR family transcriptional regulator [Nocardioides baculatus]|uniref:FadR family transcriptional regulator n=1 Tax=Nocardioides baculatus TaxID=2801337 RepID=A0ABS1LDF1_9ACTN|nr:FadR/GntR family transcriptional regulator [Nocardioides baculatus]MBL0749398.1 FadR family transcriptional regulator [Nocardioides baculatus]